MSSDVPLLWLTDDPISEKEENGRGKALLLCIADDPISDEDPVCSEDVSLLENNTRLLGPLLMIFQLSVMQ